MRCRPTHEHTSTPPCAGWGAGVSGKEPRRGRRPNQPAPPRSVILFRPHFTAVRRIEISRRHHRVPPIDRIHLRLHTLHIRRLMPLAARIPLTTTAQRQVLIDLTHASGRPIQALIRIETSRHDTPLSRRTPSPPQRLAQPRHYRPAPTTMDKNHRLFNNTGRLVKARRISVKTPTPHDESLPAPPPCAGWGCRYRPRALAAPRSRQIAWWPGD